MTFPLCLLDLVGVRKREEDPRCSPMAIRGIFTISTVVLFLLTVNHGEAIWLTIPATGGTKCVSEEIQSNVVVMADYYVVDEQNPGNTPAVSAKVRLRIKLMYSIEFKVVNFMSVALVLRINSFKDANFFFFFGSDWGLSR